MPTNAQTSDELIKQADLLCQRLGPSSAATRAVLLTADETLHLMHVVEKAVYELSKK